MITDSPKTTAQWHQLTPKVLGAIAVALLLVMAALMPIGHSPTAVGSGNDAATSVTGEAAKATTVPATATAPTATFQAARAAGSLDASPLPLDASRAERVSAATLVLVEGPGGLSRSVDRARTDLVALGGHTVRFNETEGRPTSTDPCPVPVDAYSSGGLRPVAFPCPGAGQQADSAQLVMAVPVPKVQELLRRMGRYGEVLGRATQIVDAQQGLDANAARTARLERQIVRLRELIAGTSGDTSALRAQLAQKVGELSALEDRAATTKAQVRFAQVALNLTTVRPADKPVAHNWFVRSLETGWDRLARFAERVVALLVVVLPVAAVVGLIAWPVVRWRRRGGPVGEAPPSA